MSLYAPETDDLIAAVADGVLTLTLNRPAARNALSRAMLDGLARLLEQAEADPAIGAIVITGAGGAFCAGGDVKGMAARNEGGEPEPIDQAIARQRRNQRAISGRLHAMPKPTIAAIPGAAAGAGLSIALACDLRVMAQTAFFTTAFARVGFSGDYGGTYFLTRLVGAAKARELYFLSDRVDAVEALRLGLANRVVPAEALLAEAQAMATRLASGPRVALAYMKENLNRAFSGGDMDDCLDLEATHHVHCGLTEDHREAAKAFVDKRQPLFKGR
ncbi:MAG: enoyl-CoA hydratase/isomerase family protein [Alphaproteobacteria bacterium]|nr:enoyl-CoA hydratase/isomerase family protein [Alphaproteobacteria bacterium]